MPQFMTKTVHAADLRCDLDVAINYAIEDITKDLGKNGWRVEFPIVRSADGKSADIQFAKD
jgi:hypothetical protein